MTCIDAPEWARAAGLRAVGLTVADFRRIRAHRTEMLAAVHAEVEAYVNDASLCPDDESSFPRRSRLTGAYYLGDEAYIAHREPTFVQISVMCRCLEPPKPGCERDDDYLGLEVWLKCRPENWQRFETYRNTDSSSI